MRLVIGGYAQGKLQYVLQNTSEEGYVIVDGAVPDEANLQETELHGKTVIINHFHAWVRSCMEQEENPGEKLRCFLESCKDWTIISDEIGNGIVPTDAFERRYREQTGELLVALAGYADEVIRVICGIGQKIK